MLKSSGRRTDGAESPTVALIYDFDGTLARGNLQENTFIPELGVDKHQFWDEARDIVNREDADETLVYMHLMLTKARQADKKVTRDMLRNHGREAELFSGLKDRSWFSRMNCYAGGLGLKLHHYIISSGVEEMIRGCSIFDQFEHVFASKFIYGSDDVAEWPGVAINYTTKTQYLFRINRGIMNHWDNDGVNKYMPDALRPVPFTRMVFVGDGTTDIPTMKMITYRGGYAIAVYDPSRSLGDLGKIRSLIADRRVDFVAPADYSKDSQMDIIVKGILGRIEHDVKDAERGITAPVGRLVRAGGPG